MGIIYLRPTIEKSSFGEDISKFQASQISAVEQKFGN
jgi:hypothetical protein